MDPAISQSVALVTGAGSGMGQSICCLLAKEGCSRIFLADISEESLGKTRDLLRDIRAQTEVVTHVVDVSKETAVVGMVEACVKEFGRLDCAVNCAGLARGSIKTVDTPLDVFEKLCSVNEKGVFLCEKHEIRQMLTQDPLPVANAAANRAVRGSIVNIASLAATAAMGGLAAYTGSKHGVLGLSKVDARQFANQRIRINCVSPGFVDTPMMRNAGLSDEYLAMTEAQAPMNRMTHMEEVAEAAVFLSSSRASGITGSNLLVDCGANLFHVA